MLITNKLSKTITLISDQDIITTENWAIALLNHLILLNWDLSRTIILNWDCKFLISL